MRRTRPLPMALQNQREDLLGLAHDAKLTDIAQAQVISESLVREACLLHRLSSTSTDYWQGWNDFGRSWATNSTRCHAASPSGWFLLGFAAVLLEP